MLQQGSILRDRYRIARKVGGGGMGDIYRAWDLTFNMPVALKEMRPQPDLDEKLQQPLREQFFREAKTVAQLQHPNLVNVTDYFVESDYDYLVMRFVDGVDLETIIEKEGALPEEHVLAWADQLLDALQYIHRQNIIHRDIKPANIIIQDDGTPVLVDFGLVKLWDVNDPRTQVVIGGMGTPRYAPPEQYGGNTNSTEPRSDLYSLCATLHHALTGNAPPHLSQLLSGQALPPPMTVNANVSPHVSQAIMKGMSLNLEDRHQSAEALRQALHPRVSTNKFPLPMWAIALIAFFILLFGGTGIYAAFLRPDPTPVAGDTETATTTSMAVISEEETQTPTPAIEPTNTSIPTPSPTPTAARQTISVDNVAQIVEIAKWGEPALYGASYFDKADKLLIADANHISIHDVETFAEIDRVNIGSFLSAIINDDGTEITAIYLDGVIRVWDIATDEMLDEYVGHSEPLSQIDQTADGARFLMADEEGLLKLLNADDRSVIWEQPTAHERRISVAGFSADETTILTVSNDRTIKLWETSSGRLLSTWEHDGYAILDVSMSRDGQLVASTGWDGTVKIWQAGQSEPLLANIEPDPEIVHALALSPDGSQIALGNETGEIRFRRVSDGRLEGTIPNAHRGWLNTMSYSRQGDRLVTTGSDARINIWDVTNRTIVESQEKAPAVYGVALVGDDQLATLSDDWKTTIWDMTSGRKQRDYNNILPNRFAIAPDGSQIVVGSVASDVIIHPTQGDSITLSDAHTESVRGVAYRADGELFATASGDRTVKVWQADTLELIATYENEDICCSNIAFSPVDDQLMAITTFSGVVLWDFGVDAVVRVMEEDVSFYPVAFSADGRYLMTGDYVSSFAVYDVATGNELFLSFDHSFSVNQISVSPDGKLVATAGNDAQIGLWELDEDGSLTLIEMLDGHISGVSGLTFSADGRTLISSSYDGTIRFWGVVGE